jgi:hypothetical protein
MHREKKEGTTNIGEGNCEEVKNAEAIEPLAREAANPAKFKYLTWDEFKTESNFLGVDYEASHEELLEKYLASKEAHGKPGTKKSKKDNFYNKVIDSSEVFIKTQLKDLVDDYKNNSSLTDGQKRAVEKIVKDIGIQYQLEMGAFVAACTDKQEPYDTLFYQNAVGSTLESIVAEKNESNEVVAARVPFEIRQRKTLSNNVSGSREEAATIAAPDPKNLGRTIFLPTAMILAFKALCDKIIATNKYVVPDVAIDKHFSTDFEGRKVIAPICVASSRAAANGYNTEKGIKTFVEDLDPRLEELTLVRCDTAHIWTELQVAILQKAKDCTGDELQSYISKLFNTNEDGSPVVEEGTGFYKLNKTSEIYEDIYNSTVAAGKDWERKFFCPMYDVFKEHHFKDPAYIHAGVTEKYKTLHTSKDGAVTTEFEKQTEYKSTYDQELEEIEKLRKNYCEKLLPLIKVWLCDSMGLEFSFEQKDAMKEPRKRLGALSLVMLLMDNSIFAGTLSTVAAEDKKNKGLNGRYIFNKGTLIDITEKATKEVVKVLGDNQCIKDELYSLVDQILEDKQPELLQNPGEEFILQMVYASMYAEENNQAPEQFRSNFAKIQLYCSRAVKQNAAIAEEDSVKVAQPKVGASSIFSRAPSTSETKDNAERVGSEQAVLNR